MKDQEKEKDERRGLPSASGFQRILSCEASLPLTNLLTKIGLLPNDPGSSDSRYGDVTHGYCEKLLKGEDLTSEEISSEQGQEAIELRDILESQILSHFGDISDGDRYRLEVETRFWLNHEGEEVASGRFDFIVIDKVENRAFVADFKTGWNDTPKGASNAQLGFAAVAIHETYGIDDIYVVVIETMSKIQVDRLDIRAILHWRKRIIDAIKEKDADPYKKAFHQSNDNCRYCPSRLRCPILNHKLEVSVESPNISDEISNEGLEILLETVESTKHLASAVEREMEFRITHLGSSFERYEFASSPGKRKFTNPAAACNVLISTGVKPTDLFKVISLPIGASEKLHKDATGLKGKGAQVDFSEKLGAYIDAPQTEPKIRKRK